MTSSQTLCVLFNDIVSSTEFMVALGQDDAEPQFREYRDVTHRLVEDCGGHHYRWLGDGFVAAFDSTASALELALEIQQISLLSTSGFDSRTGVAVGEVATQSDGELFGHALVVASRLCDQANTAEILCAASVPQVMSNHGAFAFEPAGERTLKGIPQPVQTVTLHRPAEHAAQRRESAVLIGRGAELTRLTDRLARTAEGAGGLCLINGEPGAGKTRLAEEVVGRADIRGFRSVWSTSFAGGVSTALSLANVLVDRLSEGDNANDVTADNPGSQPIVTLIGRDWDQLGIPVASHETLTPAERRAASYDALWRLIEHRATEQPVLMVFDDLHWADKSGVDLVRFLGQRARLAPVLVLATYRTTELNVDDLIVDIRSDVHRNSQELVELDGLSPDDVTVLGEVLAGGSLTDQVGSYLYGATGGNPFLIGELIHHSAETASIQRRDGRWHLAEGVEATVPPSIRHQLEARLRSLGHSELLILERIAAAGRSLSASELLGLSGEDDQATIAAIDRAQSAGVLLSGANGYDFVHPLLRDAVTSTMSSLRSALHRRNIAEWLASTADATQTAAEIANLYHQSRELGLSEEGVEQALLAARQAETVGDSAAAAALYGMARDMIAEADERQIELLCSEALALTWSIDPGAAEVVVEAIDRLESAGLPSDHFIASAVGAMRQAYSSVESLQRVVARGMISLGDRFTAPAAVVRLFGMAFGPETATYPGIEPQNSEVQRLYEAVKDSPYKDQHRWGHRVGKNSEHYNANQIDPDIRFYYGGDLSTLDDLQNGALSAEKMGRYGRAAALWTTAARCAVARGELGKVQGLMAKAENDLRNLPAEADVRYHVLAVVDEQNIANGIHTDLEVIRSYEPMLPSISATFMLANFRSSIGRLYAEVGARSPAIAMLDAVVPAIDLSGPAAATYLRVLWNANEIVWHLDLTERCQWLREVYETQVIPGGWRTPMTNEHLALARLAAVERDLDTALQLFEVAVKTADEQQAVPIKAISGFDAAVAIQRCGGRPAEEAIQWLDQAGEGFDSYGASSWPTQVDALKASFRASPTP